VAANEVWVLVADVEVDIVQPQPLDLVVDGAGDDVARGQFLARVEAGMKRSPPPGNPAGFSGVRLRRAPPR
jgi:hypothetical protein